MEGDKWKGHMKGAHPKLNLKKWICERIAIIHNLSCDVHKVDGKLNLNTGWTFETLRVSQGL